MKDIGSISPVPYERGLTSTLPIGARRNRLAVSLQQNSVGTGFYWGQRHSDCHSELFFEHCDPVKIAVWSAATAGDSERFAVRRERIFAAEVAPFGFPFDC